MTMQVSEFENSEKFFRAFHRRAFDIIFLDIYIDGMDGMLIAERVCKTDEACLLVFVTSSRQHAMESFRVRAFDYLLNPLYL